jgi:oligopeptide/dipeptide ABC transporter ATP-binding protein
VTALSTLGLLDSSARVSGSARLRGEDLLEASPRRLRELRGREIAVVFQDPLTALDPLQPVGRQVAEVLELHTDLDSRRRETRVAELLGEVGIPDPARRMHDYPHEMSGGMRQRVGIAIALACDPAVLIADEPTTALDVTIQAQVLRLLLRLRQTHGTAILFITHDLGIVAEIADQVAVMYAGRVVERARRDELFARPSHPYTVGLIGSVPRIDRDRGDRLVPVRGTPTTAGGAPPGCPFQPRCPARHDACAKPPTLDPTDAEPSHRVACWLDEPARTRFAEATLAAPGEAR